MRCWKCGANQDDNLDKEIRKAVLRCIELVVQVGEQCCREEGIGATDAVTDMIRKEFNLKS